MVLMIHFTRDKADKTIPSLEESLSEEQRMQQRWLDDEDNDYAGDVDGTIGDIYIMMHVCLFVTKNEHFLL